MDHYVTGTAIKALREKYRMTQAELAAQLCVSDKAVSKWETGRGFPDVSLLDPLAKALHISVPELLCGQTIVNTNRAGNMRKSRFYVCPICGNVIFSKGDALISCCGIQLPALELENLDEKHDIKIQPVEDEFFITSDHPMEKDHYLSFAAYITTDCCEIKTFYPEGNAETRFFYRGRGLLYLYCNQHGLFKTKVDNDLLHCSHS